MRSRLVVATAAAALVAFSAQAEEVAFPATLVSHAILPAATFVQPPADAPQALARAAKYTTPDRHRADQLGTVPGKDGVRLTGLSMPFDGQAVQGFPASRTWATERFGRFPTTGDRARYRT